MIIFACLVLVGFVQAAEKPWTTDFEKAKEQAKKENKLVLLDFTGSDWCPPCIALHKEVFSKKSFIEYAEEKLILVELDFPRRKKQEEALKKANAALGEKFEIIGYPTVILIDSNGKEIDRKVGYQKGGAEAFIAYLKKLEKKSAQ